MRRLPYFLGVLGLAAAVIVAVVAIIVGGAAAAQSRSWGSLAVIALCLLPLVVATFWCSLSLQVRRIRDIGWDPAMVIVSWIVFNVADSLILDPLLPALAQGYGTYHTYIGGAVNLVMTLVLLFMPSHDPSRDADEDVIASTLDPMPARVAAPVAGVRAPSGPRREFGRRGVA